MTKFVERRHARRAATKSVVVFYHANCTDGFSAAWAAWKKFGDKAEYVATFHEDPPPMDLKDREVYMLDLTFPEPITRRLMEQNIRVTAIDHHISVKPVTLMTKDPLYALHNSGAVLAWKYFHPTKPVPRLLATVEDMDLWKFKIPGTREAFSYFDMFNFDFKVWSRLVRDFEDHKKRKHMLEIGKVILKHDEKAIAREIAASAHLVELDGYKAYAINSSTASFKSSMGSALARHSPSGVGIVWWETGNGYVAVSLRSVGDTDVSQIALKHNGGGHKHAAGFRVPSLRDIPWQAAT